MYPRFRDEEVTALINTLHSPERWYELEHRIASMRVRRPRARNGTLETVALVTAAEGEIDSHQRETVANRIAKLRLVYETPEIAQAEVDVLLMAIDSERDPERREALSRRIALLRESFIVSVDE